MNTNQERKMELKFEVGKEYSIKDKRKGDFRARIDKVEGEWVYATVTVGVAQAMSENNWAGPGEPVILRLCLITTAEEVGAPRIPLEQFGRDHWNLFAYIITRTLDYRGILDSKHLKEPDPGYPYRLHGYKPNQEKHAVAKYGDRQGLEDLAAAGLVTITEEDRKPRAKLTGMGHAVVTLALEHKHDGGEWATFTVDPLRAMDNNKTPQQVGGR